MKYANQNKIFQGNLALAAWMEEHQWGGAVPTWCVWASPGEQKSNLQKAELHQKKTIVLPFFFLKFWIGHLVETGGVEVYISLSFCVFRGISAHLQGIEYRHFDGALRNASLLLTFAPTCLRSLLAAIYERVLHFVQQMQG